MGGNQLSHVIVDTLRGAANETYGHLAARPSLRTISAALVALIFTAIAKEAAQNARLARRLLIQGVPEQVLTRTKWWLFGLHRYLLGHMLETNPHARGVHRGPEMAPLLHGQGGIDGWAGCASKEPLIVLCRYALGAPKIVVTDPKALQFILSSNSYRFRKNEMTVRFISMVTGDAGLLVAQGDMHKRHRRIINPLFNMKTLKPIVPAMLESLGELYAIIDHSSPSQSLPFHDLSSQLTLNVIGRTAMSHNFDALSPGGSAVSRAYDEGAKVLNESLLLMLGLQFPNTIGRVPTRAKQVIKRNVVGTLIKDLLHNAEQNLDGVMLIHELLRQNQDKALTEHELVCELRTFLAAGHETTASALKACILMLAQHPDVQQKLFEELDAVAVRLDDYDVLLKLPQLNNVINETLRMYSPSLNSTRNAGPGGVTIPTSTLGPLHLPEGFRIEIPTRGMLLDPFVWGDDAMEWKPQRWDSIDLVVGLADVPVERIVNGRRQIGTYEYMPFLAGPRACIGRQFALMTLRLFVAGIVHRYQLTTDMPIGAETLACAISVRITDVPIKFARRRDE
ncbi:hypothetical protein AMAG_11156 [Allomyces macrogynus ATCC 38327]|nr:hypothetical protein AMAG_11156 [Allomyces macrogynus ATCC 38327]|eukprot:KNE65544.1 hypothetical protein AMAG_11156 [Allomyces macrogynus ATCC 38327]